MVPAAVWNVVSSTMVRSKYRRETLLTPRGRIDHDPARSSSRRANTDGLSNRGKHSQSMEPVRSTRAAVWQSESIAYSAMG